MFNLLLPPPYSNKYYEQYYCICPCSISTGSVKYTLLCKLPSSWISTLTQLQQLVGELQLLIVKFEPTCTTHHKCWDCEESQLDWTAWQSLQPQPSTTQGWWYFQVTLETHLRLTCYVTLGAAHTPPKAHTDPHHLGSSLMNQTGPRGQSILSPQTNTSLPHELSPNFSATLERVEGGGREGGEQPNPRGVSPTPTRPSALPQPAPGPPRDSNTQRAVLFTTPHDFVPAGASSHPHNRRRPQTRIRAAAPPPAPQADGAARRRRAARRHALAVQGGKAPSPPIGCCGPRAAEGSRRRPKRSGISRPGGGGGGLLGAGPGAGPGPGAPRSPPPPPPSHPRQSRGFVTFARRAFSR